MQSVANAKIYNYTPTGYDTWTWTINAANVKTTNATGTHTYSFILQDFSNSGYMVQFTALNKTTNSVYLKTETGGSTYYTAASVNASEVALTYDGSILSFYIDSDKVWQREGDAGPMTQMEWYTVDISGAGELPAAYSGAFYVAIGTSASSTVAPNMVGIITPFIGVIVLFEMLGIVIGLVKKSGN